MLTAAAADTKDFTDFVGSGVYTRGELRRMGCTRGRIASRLAAGRWQRVGLAVALHNGTLSREERWRAGVLNCGPRAVLASFSAAEMLGLQGWERDEIHVLAPVGVALPRRLTLPVVLHRSAVPINRAAAGQCQRLPDALVLAASSFRTARPGCGLLAAGVQQRLVSAAELTAALDRAPRVRHRSVLRTAVLDIGMGAHALSEIDFARLCRRHGLPPPTLQRVRPDSSGRRRYLDVEWDLPDGRRVVVEVDGAIHLSPRRWYADQLRQNEIVLGGALVLRYPSVVVRTEEPLVVAQLRRAVFGGS